MHPKDSLRVLCEKYFVFFVVKNLTTKVTKGVQHKVHKEIMHQLYN